MLLLSGFVTWRLGEGQREASKASLLYASRSLRGAVEAELDRYRVIAEMLARSPALVAGDLETFHTEAERAFPLGSDSWILVSDVDGRQLINQLRPPGVALPKRAAAAIAAQRRAFSTGQTQLSGVFVSAVFDGPVVDIYVPVYRDGEPFVALGLVLNLQHFFKLLNAQTMPAGWLAGILDQYGNFVARSRDNDSVVGRPASAGWLAAMAENPDGAWATFPSRTGELHYVAWVKLPGSDWTVGVSSEVEAVEAPIRAATLRLGLGGLALTALCGAIAAWLAHGIARPVRRLETAAASLVRGEDVKLEPSRIPELAKVERALTRAAETMHANAHLGAIVASTGDAVLSYAPDGRVLSWNPAAERLFGYRHDEIVGRDLASMIPPDRAAEAAEKRAQVRAGETIQLETVRLRKDGVGIDVFITAAPIRAADGTITAISAIAHDIGERKRHEAQMQFVMRELSHRTKNLLAVIQAVARQVGRQSLSVEDFQTRFGARIRALAQAHDLLVSNQWLGAPIDQVVRAQLAGFSDRIEIKGPPLMLRPEMVQNLSLAIHELATNAVKYGALSTPQGRVVVNWSADPDAAGYAFHWQESGGPIVVPPMRQGFGSSVLSYVAQGTTGGRASLDFYPEGVAWTLHLAQANFVSAH